MANIRIDLDHTIESGESVVFQAPCACSDVTGLNVYYPVDSSGTITVTSQAFIFKDAHGSDLTGLGNLFAEGALVKVLLNTADSGAYIQNADTNSYLEGRLPRYVSVTLHAANWNNNQQTVPVEGISADETAQRIEPVPAKASREAYVNAGVVCTDFGRNKLVFTADTRPTTTLYLYILIQEVRSV